MVTLLIDSRTTELQLIIDLKNFDQNNSTPCTKRKNDLVLGRKCRHHTVNYNNNK